ncbi:beta-glucosidase-like glycosyl hydrolase [Lachnospiraceae bacterium PM6-15]|uniref:glycoside hydrolase family 3 protein n=1 Tax=Ohessyouella blattaphilus TaxID=2949333 RepID=UPI003E325753
MVDVKVNPFFLKVEQVKWVEDTLASMTLEEKVGQVFCPMGLTSEDEPLKHDVCKISVGGMMYRPGLKQEIQTTHRKIQNMAKIPLLLAANTEAGGNGLVVEGTTFGAPMAVAATGDVENAYRMGYTACAEGAAVGMNWSFAPIVDIDMEFHNPITNTRTFGSDVDRVIAYGEAYMRGADENDVAVSIKHFPGDGVDERDQHLGVSINSLNAERWMATYGKVYKTLIGKGAKTVMVGHIAQPEWVKKINPNATKEQTLLPASVNSELLTGLLRGELGFNGLISTDATPMIAFCTAMKRSQAIPAAIAAGADMILFNKSLDEDYGYLMAGIQEGVVSLERLDEAVTRILAVKASLHLPEKKAAGTIVPGPEALETVGCTQHRAWAKEVEDKAITLEG